MVDDSNADTRILPAATPREGDLVPPASLLVAVDLAARSHTGKVRANNEDRYLVVRGDRSLETLLTNVEDGSVPAELGRSIYVLAVADGMGGRAAGEVASRLALTTLIQLVLNTPDWIFSDDEAYAAELVRRAVRRFRDVNTAVRDHSHRKPDLQGMGTTLTVASSCGTRLRVTHLGDSRAYLFRRGTLRQLTRDHTLAQALADTGFISPEEVATHRHHHVLTRAVGTSAAGDDPEVLHHELEDGDRLLLCTDGLTDMVDDAQIAAELGRGATADATCQALLDLALGRGGRDNVTLIVAGYRLTPAP